MRYNVKFNRGLAGLNSELHFSLTSYYTKVKKPSLLYYLLRDGRWIVGVIPKSIGAIWNASSLAQYLNSGRLQW